MTDGLATERWIDEGGRLAPEAVIEREVRAADRREAARRRGRARPHVVIGGAGVAGLEALLALRAPAGDRIDITLVAPELRFVNRSMAVAQPFSPQHGRILELARAGGRGCGSSSRRQRVSRRCRRDGRAGLPSLRGDGSASEATYGQGW